MSEALDKENLIKFLSADPKTELLKYKWMELGQGLLLNATLLKNIPKMQEDPNYRLGECLALWFSSKTAAPLTWKSFLQALVSSGEAVIASEISRKLSEFVVDDDFSKSLEEGLKKGSIKARWTKFTISGPPGSGKTSAINLLLDDEIVKQHDSTPVAMTAKVRAYNIIAEKENAHDRSQDRTWRKVVNLSREKTLHPKNKIFHLVYAVDTGGQAAFLDIAPALLRYNSVNIVTHKLNENLDAKVELYYSIKGEQFNQPNHHQLTHRQLLESVIRPSVIQQPQLDMIQAKVCSPKNIPSVIVLGTYFDKINYKDSEVLKKSKDLEETLKHFSEDVHINEYCLQEGNSYIFPVNTLHRDRHCKSSEIAKVMRRRICKSYIEADVPELWFDFYQKLANEQKSDVIDISNCVAVGTSLKMSAAEIRAALLYYHSLTIILYFPSILPNYVFLNPQPLFEKLTLIIISSYIEGERILQMKGIDLPGGARRNLGKKGVFTDDLLDELSNLDPDDNLYTTSDLIKLMIELSIIVRLPKQEQDRVDQYFIPSVLPFCDPQNKTQKFQESCIIKPLLIAWDKVMPQGFFCALVLHLLQHEVFAKDSFLKSYPGEEEIKQHRNAIELPCHSTKGGKVLLVDGITRLQVHYTGQNLSKCCEIQQTLIEVINKVDCNKKYLGKPRFQFFSMHENCVRSDKVSHSSTVNDEKTDLTCNGCGKSYNVNIELERPWLGPFTDISTEKEMDIAPTLGELTTHIQNIPEWRKLSEHLKVDPGELNELEKKDDGSQIKSILAKWLTNSSSPSRRQVIEVLKKIKREDIAATYTDAIKDLCAQRENSQKMKESSISNGKQDETDSSHPKGKFDHCTVAKKDPDLLMKKEPEILHLLKVFKGYEHKFAIVGTGLEVHIEDLDYDPRKRTNTLSLVFQRWKNKNEDTTWRKIFDVCDCFSDELGKVESNIWEFLSTQDAYDKYLKKQDSKST